MAATIKWTPEEEQTLREAGSMKIAMERLPSRTNHAVVNKRVKLGLKPWADERLYNGEKKAGRVLRGKQTI